MSSNRTRTVWIVATALAVTLVAVSVAIIAIALRDEPPTESLAPTTLPPSTTTSTVTPTTKDRSTTTTEPAEVDEAQVTVDMAAGPRHYLRIAPRGIGPDERLPVVVALHGLGVSAEGISRAADWRHAVEAERFLAVFPQGVFDSWNMGPCCPPANVLEVNDMAFLDAVVEEVRGLPETDGGQVFLTGFSNGALMTYEYACRRPDLVEAIVPMAGSNVTGCTPDRPVRLLHQHSDPDNVVPYDGGFTLGRLLSSQPFPDVPSSVGAWAAAAGCDPEPTSTIDDDEVEHFTWKNCRDGAEVELDRVPGRGHNWLTKGDYDPLRAALDFFGIT